MSLENSTIYAKMVAIQNDIDAVKKTKEMKTMSGQVQYRFRGVEDVLDEVAPIVRKHKVFIRPETISCEYSRERINKYNASGAVIGERNDTVCMLKMTYHFTDESGQSVSIGPICGEGMDSGDKSTSKANSVCYKLGMIAAFSIPVNDMPDIEDAKTDARDSVDIKLTKNTPKEEEAYKAKLISEITLNCANGTKGKSKDEKAAFITNTLGLSSFSDIKNKTIKELEDIRQKSIIAEIKF